MASERRPLRRAKKALIVLAVLTALFLLMTVTPLGVAFDFPPAMALAHRLNRWEFQRHHAYYQEAVSRISRDMAGVKRDGTAYYEASPTREALGLRRLDPPVSDAVLDRLLRDELLIEGHQYGPVIGIRFVTRRAWGGGAFSLICWDPEPYGGLMWGPNPWTEIPQVEWIDSRWWSGFIRSGTTGGPLYYPSDATPR